MSYQLKTNYQYDHTKPLNNNGFNSHVMHRQIDIFDPIYKGPKKEGVKNKLQENKAEPPPAYKNENQRQKYSKVRQMMRDSFKQSKIQLGIFQKTSKKVDFMEPEEQHDFSKNNEGDGSLLPGSHPPYIEAAAMRKMKEVASHKTKHGLHREAHVILEKVLDCEIASFGYDHPQVASTLYQIGVVLNLVGDYDGALLAIEEGIQILFPRRFSDDNMDLAALFYQYGIIKGNKGDYQSALYHLDLAGQVETHIIGYCTELTLKKTVHYKHAIRASQKLNQTRPATA